MKTEKELNLAQEEEQLRKDQEMAEGAFQKLLATYRASQHSGNEELITRTFNFANNAHRGVRRKSGEAYIMHPLAVAQILCGEMGLGATSICAGLLHDVIEDTNYSEHDLAVLFSPRIAAIVEGVSKIQRSLDDTSNKNLQVASLLKIIITMNDDIRVILVKLADRLHNLRTLNSMPENKKLRTTGETLMLFAPIAERLGLNKIKSELEDLSFSYEHPDEYKQIVSAVSSHNDEFERIVNDFVPPIKESLDKLGFKYRIVTRIKTPYSIWKKVNEQGIMPKSINENVFDILAIRIIYTPHNDESENDDIYRIYGALTRLYRPHPERFRDWVADPKRNGYSALHNTFMSKQGRWVEVQIRSERMDDIAETGFAAHWKYKDKDGQNETSAIDQWIDETREILNNPEPNEIALLDSFRLSLYSREIIIYTPKGDRYVLPQGATVLDFAYHIHTTLGNHCAGAKIDNKLVSNDTKLSSGNQVFIISLKNIEVDPTWLNKAITAKARAKIAHRLRQLNREKVRKGIEMLYNFLNEQGFDRSISLIDRIQAYYSFPSRDNLCVAVSEGRVVPGDGVVDFLRGRKRRRSLRSFLPFGTSQATKEEGSAMQQDLGEINTKKPFYINNISIQRCAICEQCHPIPGDDIIGYLTPEKILEIHNRDCPLAVRHKMQDGKNLVTTFWDLHREHRFPCKIYVKGIDRRGIIRSMADILDNNDVRASLQGISINAKGGVFEGELTFELFDTEEAKDICKLLQTLPDITVAKRKRRNE